MDAMDRMVSMDMEHDADAAGSERPERMEGGSRDHYEGTTIDRGAKIALTGLQ